MMTSNKDAPVCRVKSQGSLFNIKLSLDLMGFEFSDIPLDVHFYQVSICILNFKF